MINNIDKIKNLLKFESDDDFYFLQIIKRKKEHPELGSNSLIVKTYYIKSIEHLEKVFPEIVVLCNFHNARAGINLNKRSFEKIAFQVLRKTTDIIMNKDYSSCKSAYDSVCGTYTNETEKKWIIDIDVKDLKLIEIVRNDIKNCQPNKREDKVIDVLETKNGYHIITKPFNLEEYMSFSEIEAVDIHKDNPTILYIP